MRDQAGDVIGAALAAIGAEHHPGLARLEQLSRPEHELNGQLRLLHASHFRYGEAKRHPLG